jgi:hypothetical protein
VSAVKLTHIGVFWRALAVVAQVTHFVQRLNGARMGTGAPAVARLGR